VCLSADIAPKYTPRRVQPQTQADRRRPGNLSRARWPKPDEDCTGQDDDWETASRPCLPLAEGRHAAAARKSLGGCAGVFLPEVFAVLGAEVNRPLPLAHSALVMAAAVRGGQVPGVIMHTDQRSEGGFNRSSQHRFVVRSTGAAGRWCSRWRQAARGCAGRRSRSECRCRCAAARGRPSPRLARRFLAGPLRGRVEPNDRPPRSVSG